MKVFKSDSRGVYAYQKIFKHIHSKGSKIVIWQMSSSSGRSVANSKLSSFQIESGFLKFEIPSNYLLQQSSPIYFYSEDGQLIFKSEGIQLDNDHFSVQLPHEIKLLEEDEVGQIKFITGLDISTIWMSKRFNFDDVSKVDFGKVVGMTNRTSRDKDFLDNEFARVSIEDEDKLYADKRESPRARPRVDKWVKILSQKTPELQLLRVFDLSRGGISFVAMEIDLFPIGSKVNIVAIEEHILDDPLLAEVMSHRPIDELDIEFKIGCKFDEGQA
jgi:hypothetical protein